MFPWTACHGIYPSVGRLFGTAIGVDLDFAVRINAAKANLTIWRLFTIHGCRRDELWTTMVSFVATVAASSTRLLQEHSAERIELPAQEATETDDIGEDGAGGDVQ
jgi:hypothetical protein